MSFMNAIIQLLSQIKLFNDKNLVNLSLIVRYTLNEAQLLKFAVEALFIKKNHNSQVAPLLEFFKKNCFFRDYIYL